MKILHIIDKKYFETHRKTISELLLSLSYYKVEQKIYTSEETELFWLKDVCPIERWKSNKAKLKSLSNRFKTWLLFSSFSPDIVIKWGKDARDIMQNYSGVQISYMNEVENLKSFENTDYIITNNETVLSYVKANGYSGARSFLLPSFVQEYQNTSEITKKEYFLPEKAKIVYLGGTFKKNIGYERAFDALAVVNETYFFIAGSGPDEEYIKDCALKVNLKARSRFIPEPEKSLRALALAEFAFLPFDDAELSKYLMEAMFAKKMVVCVKNSFSEDFIVDGKTGFFVPKNDMYLIKKKLKEILSLSEEEKQVIVNNAFDMVKNYTSSMVIPGYIQMFEELVKKYKSRKNLLNN